MTFDKPPNDPNEIKASVESIIGWRVWKLVKPHYLLDLNSTHMWEPYEEMVAECRKGHEHLAPHDGCSCGLYSFVSLDELKLQHYIQPANATQTLILGRVANWGRVIEYDNLYKSQFAYPTELYVEESIGHIAEWLGQRYGVPCVVGSEDMWLPIDHYAKSAKVKLQNPPKAGQFNKPSTNRFWSNPDNVEIYRLGYFLKSVIGGKTLAQHMVDGEVLQLTNISSGAVVLQLPAGYKMSLRSIEEWGCPFCHSAHGSGVHPSRSPNSAQLAKNQFYFNPKTKRLFTISDTCYVHYVASLGMESRIVRPR